MAADTGKCTSDSCFWADVSKGEGREASVEKEMEYKAAFAGSSDQFLFLQRRQWISGAYASSPSVSGIWQA